jgi:hypothetical protein
VRALLGGTHRPAGPVADAEAAGATVPDPGVPVVTLSDQAARAPATPD